jgi:hypothetical protein
MRAAYPAALRALIGVLAPFESKQGGRVSHDNCRSVFLRRTFAWTNLKSANDG